MTTFFSSEQPLPWCSRCQVHNVHSAGDLCPLCADPTPTAPIQLSKPLPPVPAPRFPLWIEKLLGRTHDGYPA